MIIRDIENMYVHCEHKYDKDFSDLNVGDLHSHLDILEIIYVIKGNHDYMIESNIYPAEKGDIFIFRPDELHGTCRTYGEDYERLNIYIKTDFFKHRGCEKIYEMLYEREPSSDNVVNVECASYDIKGQLERLDGYMCDGCTEMAVIESVIIELLYMLAKSTGASYHREYKNTFVSDIISFIHNNLQKDVHLDTISERLHINKQYMCRLFRRETGITINDYILRKRLQLAAQLYSENGSLLRSALESGFGSYSAFYKEFKKRYGYVMHRYTLSVSANVSRTSSLLSI